MLNLRTCFAVKTTPFCTTFWFVKKSFTAILITILLKWFTSSLFVVVFTRGDFHARSDTFFKFILLIPVVLKDIFSMESENGHT